MRLLANLSLTAKLVGAFLVTSVLAVLLGLFAIVQLDKVNQTANEMQQRWMPSVRTALEMNMRMNAVRRDELQHILSVSEADLARYDNQLKETLVKFDAARAEYEKLDSTPAEQQAFDSFMQSWRGYLLEHEKVLAASRGGRNDEAKALNRGESAKLFRAAADDLNRIVEINVAGGADASKRGDELFAASRTQMIAGLAVIAALGLALGWLISRAITCRSPARSGSSAASRKATSTTAST
jgi:CHASE3 domain sensor protein